MNEVVLLDNMGDDLTVVNAARVSMAKSSRRQDNGQLKPEDVRLINYLAKHSHFTPFGQVTLTFRFTMPIFIARQWYKHKVGLCIAGDSEITFIKTNKEKTSGKYTRTIKELYDKWQLGRTSLSAKGKISNLYTTIKDVESGLTIDLACKKNNISIGTFYCYKKSKHCGNKKQITRNKIRVLDESNNKFIYSHIKNIVYNGKSPVYQITTDGGKKLKMTKDHQILTDTGWLPLNVAVGLDEKYQIMTKPCRIATNGIEIPIYRDYEWLKNEKESGYNVTEISEHGGCSYHTIRKWLKIHKLQFDQMNSMFDHNKKFGVWNKNKFGYKTNRILTLEHRKKISDARSGEKNNFWKGGKTEKNERIQIAIWTASVASEVHKRNNYKCVRCGKSENLRCHHIVPIYKSKELSKNLDNLITVCDSCHKWIHRSEENVVWFIDNYNKISLSKDVLNKEKKVTHRFLKAKYENITKIEFIGEEDVYDIEIDGNNHNFVANGIVVHNCENEVSRRYVSDEPTFFLPEYFRPAAENVKQGSEDARHIQSDYWEDVFIIEYENCKNIYQAAIKDGVCPEQARMILPQAMMTEFIQTGSLAAYARICKLRQDSHAQKETQWYANEVSNIINTLYPVSWKALMEN